MVRLVSHAAICADKGGNVKLSLLESINLAIFGSIGFIVSAFGFYQIYKVGIGPPFWAFGFFHPPETFAIAGAGLFLLVWKWKLYGFPLFLIGANLVENAWLFYNIPYNAIQITFMLFGYAVAKPVLKNFSYLMLIVYLNVLPSSVVDFHHIAEIGTYIVLLFGIKSLGGVHNA